MAQRQNGAPSEHRGCSCEYKHIFNDLMAFLVDFYIVPYRN